MLSRSNPPGVATPIGKYHHAVTVPAGVNLMFVSGQVGDHPGGSPVTPDAAPQARQAFANLGVILEDFVFAGWYPDGEVPAHSLGVAAGLAAPELLIEIEAVVAVPCP